MSTFADARRRWYGAFFLVLAGGMLVWGQTWLQRYLTGWSFVVYWTACFVLTALAMVVALLDMRAVRQRTQQEHRKLLRHMFTEDQPDHGAPPHDGSHSHKLSK